MDHIQIHLRMPTQWLFDRWVITRVNTVRSKRSQTKVVLVLRKKSALRKISSATLRSTAGESDVPSAEFLDGRLPASCQTERGRKTHHLVPTMADRRQKAASARDRGQTTNTEYRAALRHQF